MYHTFKPARAVSWTNNFKTLLWLLSLARLLYINYYNYDAGGHGKTWKKLPKNICEFGLK